MNIDFKDHNLKSKRVWDDFISENPSKVPVIIYTDVRNWLYEEKENVNGITLNDYIKDKDIMFESQILAQEWSRLNILSDAQMGYSEEDGWYVAVDFENFTELAWFGGEIKYGIEPHILPFITDENKYSIFERGIPDAFDGFGCKVKEYYEHFKSKAEKYIFKGIPVKNVSMPYNFYGTDGIFTIACGIRGTTNFLLDMIDEPDYANKLLDFITTSIIQRMKKVRQYMGHEQKSMNFGYADDSIVLLSNGLFTEMILPNIKRIYDEFSLEGCKRSIHLCGDAQRFFPLLEKELNIKEFDTGYPIDFKKLYEELSPDVQVMGGPNIMLLKSGTVQQVKDEVKKILHSGVMIKSKKFILREANAVAPGTPLENVNAIYEACEEYGYYDI